jgi:hypothetical protein
VGRLRENSLCLKTPGIRPAKKKKMPFELTLENDEVGKDISVQWNSREMKQGHEDVASR